MNRLLIVLGSLLLAAALTWVALNSLELKPVDRKIPPSRQSLANPYLALERSLSPGLTIEHYTKASPIVWGETAVLITDALDLFDFYYRENAPYSDSEKELKDWIFAGGCLIIICTKPDTEDETAEKSTIEFPDDDLFNDLTPEFADFDEEDTADPTILTMPAGLDRLPQGITMGKQVNFPQVNNNWGRSTTIFLDHGVSYGVLRHYGKGILWVSGQPFALRNEGLKISENRMLAALIFGDIANSGKSVWLPATANPQPTAQIESLDPNPVTVSAALVCLFLFWMLAPRLGPVIPDSVQHRKSLRERFLAEGRFLWRSKVGGRIVGIEKTKGTISKAEFIDAVNKIVKTKPTGAPINHDH